MTSKPLCNQPVHQWSPDVLCELEADHDPVYKHRRLSTYERERKEKHAAACASNATKQEQESMIHGETFDAHPSEEKQAYAGLQELIDNPVSYKVSEEQADQMREREKAFMLASDPVLQAQLEEQGKLRTPYMPTCSFGLSSDWCFTHHSLKCRHWRGNSFEKNEEKKVEKKAESIPLPGSSKYLRTIHSAVNPAETIQVDVYNVTEAYHVICPGRQHALKKLLCSGIRGKGSQLDDLVGAQEALSRAIEMQTIREREDGNFSSKLEELEARELDRMSVYDDEVMEQARIEAQEMVNDLINDLMFEERKTHAETLRDLRSRYDQEVALRSLSVGGQVPFADMRPIQGFIDTCGGIESAAWTQELVTVITRPHQGISGMKVQFRFIYDLKRQIWSAPCEVSEDKE